MVGTGQKLNLTHNYNVLFNNPLNRFCLHLHGRKEMFYLTTNSRNYIYGYMVNQGERKPIAVTIWATLFD